MINLRQKYGWIKDNIFVESSICYDFEEPHIVIKLRGGVFKHLFLKPMQTESVHRGFR